MIRVTCPDCRTAREYPDHFAGEELPCRACGAAVVVGGPNAVRTDGEPGSARRFVAAYLAAVFLFPTLLSALYFWLQPRRRGSQPLEVIGGDWVFLAAVVGLFVCGPLGVLCLRWGFSKRGEQPKAG